MVQVPVPPPEQEVGQSELWPDEFHDEEGNWYYAYDAEGNVYYQTTSGKYVSIPEGVSAVFPPYAEGELMVNPATGDLEAPAPAPAPASTSTQSAPAPAAAPSIKAQAGVPDTSSADAGGGNE